MSHKIPDKIAVEVVQRVNGLTSGYDTAGLAMEALRNGHCWVMIEKDSKQINAAIPQIHPLK